MDSTVIEEIIYGSWLVNPASEREMSTGRRGVRTVRNGEGSARGMFEREWKELARYFSLNGIEAQEILNETDFPLKKFSPEQLLFYPEKASPDSAFALQLNRLLELEACRLMGLVIERVNSADSEDDQFYIVTLAMRKWSDYLIDLHDLNNGLPDYFRGMDRPAEEIHKWLIALICDLSVRYSGLDLKERFTREEIYPMLLDQGAPFVPEIYATKAMVDFKWRYMAATLLEENPDETMYQRFLEELEVGLDDIKNGDAAATVVKAIHHTENLVLLSYWQTGEFMEDNRETLLDPLVAGEWVRGVREEALDRMSKSMKKTLKKLWSIKQQMKPFLDAGDNVIVHVSSGDSEARRFMTEVEQADRVLFHQPFSGRPGTGQTRGEGESNPFVNQAGEKFMSKEHMYEYLKIKNRTTRNNFLEKAGFRYVELTDQKHLVYVEDIEEYFEKNTKRYGGGE